MATAVPNLKDPLPEAVSRGAARGPDLWAALDRLHKDLLARIGEHEQLCTATMPDRGTMSMCRWRVAQAGRVRMDHLHGQVFPFLMAAGFMPAAVQALIDATPAYRQRVSTYLSRWTNDSMAAEWPAYRLAARDFRLTIRERVAAEVALLRPLLISVRAS